MDRLMSEISFNVCFNSTTTGESSETTPLAEERVLFKLDTSPNVQFLVFSRNQQPN